MREIVLLLVEDNEDDRFLTIRILRKLPFPVSIEIAKNGDEALRIISESANDPDRPLPDMVLLDLQMPKIGGLHLLEKIREKFSPEEIPVIVLSSSDNPGDIAACKALGISAYLPKPIDINLLQEHFHPGTGC